MDRFVLGVALFLLVNIFVGLYRVLRGPSPADRLIAAQLFGTTGVGILLLLAVGMDVPGVVDIALVFALLAMVAAAAFARLSRGGTWGGGK
jgi:multicomponent Na+:H+ antiporter subunit F